MFGTTSKAPQSPPENTTIGPRSDVSARVLNLGDRVKHKVHGLQGIVIGITEWLYGCRGVCVQPEELKDGKPLELVHTDEHAWNVMATKTHVATPVKTGGPVSTVERTH